jgi:hypothetical protein
MNTLFALMAEFDTADIPLEKVAPKYFGLQLEEAKRQASMNKLPVPAFRAGSQKAPWLVSAADLARWIDERRAAARLEWEKSRSAGTGRHTHAPA